MEVQKSENIKKQKSNIKSKNTKIKTETDQKGDDELNQIQSKYPTVFKGRMRPDPSIEYHPAFPTLLQYATEGCPVDCGEPWSKEHLEAAIEWGPHVSAKLREAATCLREEALKKVQQGFGEVFRWEDIKGKPHPNLKKKKLSV